MRGDWRGVKGCFSFTVQARFMVLLLFFVLIVKAKEKNRNQMLGDEFSKKSSYASTGTVFILLVEYILKERNNMDFWKELMNSLRTVSKQSAAL